MTYISRTMRARQATERQERRGVRKAIRDRNEAMAAAYRDGEHVIAIGARFGLSEPSVRTIVSRQGALRPWHDSVWKWTPEREATLRAMHAAKTPFSAIAAAMGISRNAVIGKVHRMKLPARGPDFGRRRLSEEEKRERLNRKLAEIAPRPARARPPKPKAQPLPPEPSALPDSKPVSILARTGDQCPFVLGKPNGVLTMMCGAPKETGRHWCAYHQRIVYRPGTAMKAARLDRRMEGVL